MTAGAAGQGTSHVHAVMVIARAIANGSLSMPWRYDHAIAALRTTTVHSLDRIGSDHRCRGKRIPRHSGIACMAESERTGDFPGKAMR